MTPKEIKQVYETYKKLATKFSKFSNDKYMTVEELASKSNYSIDDCTILIAGISEVGAVQLNKDGDKFRIDTSKIGMIARISKNIKKTEDSLELLLGLKSLISKDTRK